MGLSELALLTQSRIGFPVRVAPLVGPAECQGAECCKEKKNKLQINIKYTPRDSA